MSKKDMDNAREDKRVEKRTYIEPYDSGTSLEFTLEGKKYRFNLLDTSPGGMGMLVPDGDGEVLKKLKIGHQIKMKYKTKVTSVFMDFEIRHITPIDKGKFEGDHMVGLSLQGDPKKVQ